MFMFTVCFVGALCTELEKTGTQHMFRVYRHFVWKLYTFSYFHSLTISRGSKHLCSRALVLPKTHINIKTKKPLRLIFLVALHGKKMAHLL